MDLPPSYDQLYPREQVFLQAAPQHQLYAAQPYPQVALQPPPVVPVVAAVTEAPYLYRPSPVAVPHLLPQSLPSPSVVPSYATVASHQPVVVNAIPLVQPRALSVQTLPPQQPPKHTRVPFESLPCPRFVDTDVIDYPRQCFNAYHDCLYPFQQEILKKIIHGNSIVYLPTGAGKTVVAAALAAHKIASEPTKKIVFIVNRVPLIAQQSAVLRTVKSLRVAEVSSERKHADCWEDVMRSYDAVVIIDALFHGWLIQSQEGKLLKDVSLLVLDEVHHARKQSYYAKILRLVSEQSTQSSVHVIGLSASPAAREDKARTRRALEDLMVLSRSVLVAVEHEISDLKNRISVPDSMLVEYLFSHVEAVTDQMIRATTKTIEDDLFRAIAVVDKRCGDAFRTQLDGIPHGSRPYVDRCRGLESAAASNNYVGQRHLARFLGRINLGIILLEEASLIETIRFILSDEDNLEFFFGTDDSPMSCEEMRVDRVIAHHGSMIIAQLTEYLRYIHKRRPQLSPAVAKSYETSSKMLILFDLLRDLDVANDSFRGIVFCDTKAATSKIVAALKNEPVLQMLNPRWFVGHNRTLVEDGDSYKTLSMSDSQQQQCLNDFRQGVTKLLVATSVAEEGLDIPICSLVIRYEGAFSVQSFIQSRGRARQAGANFIVISKMSGLNPFRQVLHDIAIQEEVIREIINEDQLAIVNGRVEPSERAFWEKDPRYFLDLFSRMHNVKIVTDRQRVSAGVHASVYVDIDSVGDGTLRRVLGTGIGSEKNATNIAEFNLCKELFRLSLLPSIQYDDCATKARGVERLTFTYYSSSLIALSSRADVGFLAASDASTAPVKTYVPSEWEGRLPYQLLLETVSKKKLPYDKVSYRAVGDTAVVVFPTRTLRGDIEMKEARFLHPEAMIAKQSAAILALAELDVFLVRRLPGSMN